MPEPDSAPPFDFEPDPQRAIVLDRAMRNRLAESIGYIFTEMGEELPVDRTEVDALVARIRQGAQSPQTFGVYYDLVLTIEAGDAEQALRLARELVAPPPPFASRVTAFQDRPAHEAERYARLFLSGRSPVLPTTDEQFADGCRRVDDALGLLEAGFPEMAAEIRALLQEIVLAAGPAEGQTFSQASSFMLWGGMLLNAVEPMSRLDIVQALAHESGHNLLFGLCTHGALVENPDDELHASPIRADPRPMDGVVHAAVIIARMHQAVRRLLLAGVLDADERAAAERDLETHSEHFIAGDHTVSKGARLTPLGSQVMEAARAYMASAAN